VPLSSLHSTRLNTMSVPPAHPHYDAEHHVVVYDPYDPDNPSPPFWPVRSRPTAYITIHQPHPSYPNSASETIRLPLYDRVGRADGTESTQFGMHYGTLITACTIVAGNVSDAFLTHDREGQKRLVPADAAIEDIGDDVIVGVTECFLHLPGWSLDIDSEPYPIVGSFEEWVFPGTTGICPLAGR
jgi:hypothetical protein